MEYRNFSQHKHSPAKLPHPAGEPSGIDLRAQAKSRGTSADQEDGRHHGKRIYPNIPEEISHLNFMANEVVVGGLGARYITHEERLEDEK